MKIRILIIVVLCAVLAASAQTVETPSAAARTEPDPAKAIASPVFGGGLALPVSTFLPHAFDKMWHGYGPVEVRDDGATAGVFGPHRFRMAVAAGDDAPAFDGSVTFAPDAAGAIRAEWQLAATADAVLNEIFVGGDVPFARIGGGKAILDGRELPIPAEIGREPHLHRGAVTDFALIDRNGAECLRIVFDAPVRVLLQDDRHYRGDGLAVRFYLAFGPVKAGAEYRLAATFSTPADGPLAMEGSRPVRLVQGDGWTPLRYDPWIVPGSALDFTGVVPHDAPAGKFGRVVVAGDHFEFENIPGKPQRFYGVNLCGTANLPETEAEADRFAANLARIGYNAVRIHHHEKWLVSKDGTLPADAGVRGAASPPLPFDDTALDPAQIAKLDLLVAACVRHGIYITTDLYVSRAHVVAWRAIGIDRDGPVRQDDYKLLVAFHEPAFSNLCAWAKNFLGHVNPHTGRSLADEPALATLALVNEGNLGNYGVDALRRIPGVEQAWNEWLSRRMSANVRKSSMSTNPRPLPDDVNDPALAIFLAERETMLFERLKAFVREECGCAAPLSNLSAWYNPVQYQLVRTHFDYVDDHFYVDHPSFLGKQWRLPSRCTNANPFLGAGKGAQGAEWLRLMDKPFCITEFNYSGPGSYRGVGGVALGALAALQDWSGLWRFAWSHSRGGIVSPGGRLGYFDVSGDPLALAAERAGLCLFLRGDMAPLAEERPELLSEAALRDPRGDARKCEWPERTHEGWKVKVGTRVAKGETRQTTAEGAAESVAGAAPSAPVPVSISPDGTFLIDTPCTAGGFAESGAHAAGPLRFELFGGTQSRRAAGSAEENLDLSLMDNCEQLKFVDNENRKCPQLSTNSQCPQIQNSPAAPATIWASSLDGEPLAASSHILVSHLTDVQNDGIEYADQEHKILLDWGRTPHIMRNGAARIELELSANVHKSSMSTNENENLDLGLVDNCEQLEFVDNPFAVYRISSSGRRLAEVPFDLSVSGEAQGVLSFTARTDYDPSSATYLYEIVRK